MIEKLVWTIESEWDIGQEYVAFSSAESAREWIEENMILKKMEDYNIDQYFKNGLLNIRGTKLFD